MEVNDSTTRCLKSNYFQIQTTSGVQKMEKKHGWLGFRKGFVNLKEGFRFKFKEALVLEQRDGKKVYACFCLVAGNKHLY